MQDEGKSTKLKCIIYSVDDKNLNLTILTILNEWDIQNLGMGRQIRIRMVIFIFHIKSNGLTQQLNWFLSVKLVPAIPYNHPKPQF